MILDGAPKVRAPIPKETRGAEEKDTETREAASNHLMTPPKVSGSNSSPPAVGYSVVDGTSSSSNATRQPISTGSCFRFGNVVVVVTVELCRRLSHKVRTTRLLANGRALGTRRRILMR